MRTKKFILNSMVDIVGYFLIGIVGMIKFKVIASTLGSDINGYFQFINNTLSYIFIAEASFVGATIFKLYKPLANNDEVRVKEIIKGSRDFLFKSAKTLLTIIVFCSFLFYIFVDGDTSVKIQVSVCFLLIGISYTLTHFFYSSLFLALYTSSLNKYKYSFVFNTLRLMGDILIIIFLLNTNASLITIGIIVLLIKIIEEYIVCRMGMRDFGNFLSYDDVEKDTSAHEMMFDLIWSNLAFLVVNSTDNFFLTFLVAPEMASIYSAYMIISRFLLEIINKINSSISNIFGNMFAIDDEEHAASIFSEYRNLTLLIAYSIAITFFIFINVFVTKLWMNDVDISYAVNQLTIVAFSLSIFISIIYMPLTSIMSAKGLFKKTKQYTIISMCINLFLTFTFVNIFDDENKIFACVIATIISYIYSIFCRINLVQKEIFPSINKAKYYLYYIVNIVIFIILTIVLTPLTNILLNMNVFENPSFVSFMLFVIMACCTFITITFITFLVIYMFNKDILKTVKRLLIIRRK